MKIQITVLFSFFILFLHAQSNEIGLSLYKFEKSSITLNNRTEPKLVNGIYFNKNFNHLQWYSLVEYGENELNDYCTNCYDAAGGTGVMKEVLAKSGIGYEWSPNLGSGQFLAFARVLAKGGWLNYSGRFYGGWGGGFEINRRHWVAGGEVELGIGYQFKSNFILRVSANEFLAKDWFRNYYNIDQGIKEGQMLSSTKAQFSIGYSF